MIIFMTALLLSVVWVFTVCYNRQARATEMWNEFVMRTEKRPGTFYFNGTGTLIFKEKKDDNKDADKTSPSGDETGRTDSQASSRDERREDCSASSGPQTAQQIGNNEIANAKTICEG